MRGMTPTDQQIVAIAARNNSEWCDIVCRVHGLPGAFDAEAWANPRRTPPYYPDAVTLVRTPNVDRLLSRIDAAAGCTLKDSFASVDLAARGFRVLFDAEWIHRPAQSPTGCRTSAARWTRIADPDALIAWETAWSEAGIAVGLFAPGLLADQSVAILGKYADDRIVAGVILNLANGVVGLSNAFAPADDDDALWSEYLDAVAVYFPSLPIVGYESGATLAAAHRHGFTSAGPLRVWINAGTATATV
jgi:hypothetical protein